MLGDQPLDLGDHRGVLAEGQAGVDQILLGRQAEVFQPGRLGLGEGLEGEIGQRRAPPQGQRLDQPGTGRLGVAGRGQLAGLGGHPLEANGVHRFGIGPQHVAGRLAGQHLGRRAGRAVRFECLAQVGDVRLQRAGGPSRRLVTPELVDQPVERHHPVDVDQQDSQDGALFPAADVHQPALDPNFEWPQNVELQRSPSGPYNLEQPFRSFSKKLLKWGRPTADTYQWGMVCPPVPPPNSSSTAPLLPRSGALSRSH